jgi:serine/threonine protein kinase
VRKQSGARKRAPAEPTRIGHYEIIERIGVGGMAEAFRAFARGPGGYQRQVIVKCILPHLANDPEFVRLFVAEAKILGMLHHPNVVQVYDFGEHDGRHFLALEYLDGPSVDQVRGLILGARSPMPTGVAAYIAREMCLGLAAAHDLCGPDNEPLGVVHRDVSPTNVLITSGGEVKLVDFGIAKLGPAGGGTKAGTVRGKPAYLAPEQILSGPIDRRADIFATGIVLYEMLTLEPLFRADNDLATIYRVLESPIAPPSERRPGLPAAIDEIVMRALQRPPDDRYQTAGEMAADLSQFLTTVPVGREEIAALASTFIKVSQRRRARGQSNVAEQPTVDVKSARPTEHLNTGKAVTSPPAPARRARRKRAAPDRTDSK